MNRGLRATCQSSGRDSPAQPIRLARPVPHGVRMLGESEYIPLMSGARAAC